jgi:hyperpolarization activated cyclic nucleotide-gated potassium channel 2
MLIDVMKLLGIIFFIAHWIGCFFFAVSYAQIDQTPLNWVNQKGYTDGLTFYDQYLTSLYWSFMTMTTVGYGDIVPYSSDEKIYTIFMMIVSCGVFAWIMGTLGSFFERGDANLQVLKDEVFAINKFMVHNEIPHITRKKVKRYLEHVIEYKRQFKLEEEEVLGMLSENLSLELQAHLNGSKLHDTTVFKNFDIIFLSQLTFCLKKEFYANEDYIFEEGHQG